MTTIELIEGCKLGHQKCQEQLVRTYAPTLLAICRRYTKDSEIANDALQETFINVFKYIKKFEGKGSFEGWLKRIAVNCSITFQKRYFKHNYESEAIDNHLHHAEVPDVYSKMGKDDILALLTQLPDSLYTVFNLCIIEGYNHREVSEMLDISEGTSRASLSRARNRLIEIIENQKKKETEHLAWVKSA